MNSKINPTLVVSACRFTLKTVIAGVAGCFLVWNASADPISGSSSGIFKNPVPGADNTSPTYTGIGSSDVTWGAGGDPSELTYLPSNPFSGVTETPFTIGSLDYYNGGITAGSGLDGLSLDLSITLTLPTGISHDFLYALQLINTPNNGVSDYDDADYVILSTFPNTTFTLNGTLYTLTLAFGTPTGSGVVDTGGNEFHVYEEGSATAPLIGTITTDVAGVVPDGGSTILFLGFGIVILVGIQRKITSSAGA